jgi:polysaccharide biosynthesis transport protein
METPIMAPQDYLAIVKRRKWMLILPLAAIILASTLVALVLPPIYKSTTTILIEQQDVPAEFVKAAVSTYAEQQLQIINQRIMSSIKLLEIIKRFNLYTDLQDTLMTEEIIARMRGDIKLEPISVNVVDPKTGRPTEATIAFSLSYDSNNPEKALQVANVLASLFLEENAQARERKASEVSRFLESETSKVKADLDKIDASIAQFKEKHVNDLPELLQVNMQSVMDVERNIDTLNNQLSQLKDKEGYLKTQLAGIPPEFKEADKQRLNELNIQLVNLKNKFSEEHPDVIKTKSEIADIEKRLKVSNSAANKQRPDNPAYITLSAQLSSTQSEIQSINSQINDLKQRLSEYKGRIVTSPQVESEYKALIMERNNTQAKHDDLMRKFMEAKVSQGLEKEQKGERFTIIDPARLPEKPYKPNRMAIMLIGLVLGLGAGVGTAAVREYTDTSPRSASMLSLATAMPVLAIIPMIITQKEIKRSKMKWIIFILAGIMALIIGLILFHFFVMDLGIFWIRMARWRG